ncbi:hypothetical protein DSO57_1002491 [Entomophthora muscae]|uniref:Uncharacterized protein n=1 Tax=Entomophthora muscae TaxID=34485 RepID=A0ACC2SLS8_9FUNG|nr:hypothetical protein DSO57_1002491 [Entomophthora muscae]
MSHNVRTLDGVHSPSGPKLGSVYKLGTQAAEIAQLTSNLVAGLNQTTIPEEEQSQYFLYY